MLHALRPSAPLISSDVGVRRTNEIIIISMPYYFTTVYLPLTALADCSYPFLYYL